MEEICIVNIVDNLYIGTHKTAMNKTVLQSSKITHILSVGSEIELGFKNEYKYMNLQVTDSEDENILFNFDDVYYFIEEGCKVGSVLIHCNECISKGPAIAIAYLIKKFEMNFDQAYNTLKEKKSDINLNEDLVEKLSLLHKKLNRVVENVYKCSICRKTLFDDSNLDFEHEFTPKKNYSYKRYKKSFVNTNECTSYFLNSLSFVNINSEFGGKIMCVNEKLCKNKIGEFNPKGNQCSCGSWVVPAIQILKSKVDKVPVHKTYTIPKI